MKFLRTSILAVVLLGSVVAPHLAFAAGLPVLDGSFHIVPDAHDLDESCKVGAPLSFGAVMYVAQNFVNAGISFGILFFVIIMVWSGILFIASVTNPESRSAAKKMLENAVIGMLIILSAWLMVDFVMKTLYNPNKAGLGPWNNILNGGVACVIASAPLHLYDGAITVTAITSSADSGGSGGQVTPGQGTSKLNIAAAVSYALSHAKNAAGGQCALYVRLALAAGGLTTFDTSHPGYAYQYGPYLTKAGFTSVLSGTYKSGMGTPAGVQKGDVVVFQPVTGHTAGHIAIFDGSSWVSDYRQVRMSSNDADYNGGSYAIYRP